MKKQVSETSVADRLRAARLQAGLSQGQAARLASCQRPTISEIEAGRRKVSSDELVLFANLYDVSTSWLLSENVDEKNPVVELAARELAKLKVEDLDRILKLLRSLRRTSGER